MWRKNINKILIRFSITVISDITVHPHYYSFETQKAKLKPTYWSLLAHIQISLYNVWNRKGYPLTPNHVCVLKSSRTLEELESPDRCWSTEQTCVQLECNFSHSISSNGQSFPLAVKGSLKSRSSVDACRELPASTAKQLSIMSNVHNLLLGMECRFTKIIFHWK